MGVKGTVFDIQSFSVHDGPGCRTTVFLTGCPLHCEPVCPAHAIHFPEGQAPVVDLATCASCTTFDCVDICPNRALKQCVKEYTSEELLKILRRDFSSWGQNGGVTFSGGDPILQHDFLVEVLKGCRDLQIHTAIETSAYFDTARFLDVMQYIQFAFIDVKRGQTLAEMALAWLLHHDEVTTVLIGASKTQQILDNIRALVRSGWTGRLVLRQPTIGGYNDSEENARKVIAFMQENGLFEINLLKFHRMGQTKWEQLGKEYAYASKGDVTDETLQALQALYLDAGIACYVGNRTTF